MYVFCKVCTCLIIILMKKMNLVGDSCMYMSMQRWIASLLLLNELSSAGYPAGTLFVCRRTMSAGEQTEVPAPRPLPFMRI